MGKYSFIMVMKDYLYIKDKCKICIDKKKRNRFFQREHHTETTWEISKSSCYERQVGRHPSTVISRKYHWLSLTHSLILLSLPKRMNACVVRQIRCVYFDLIFSFRCTRLKTQIFFSLCHPYILLHQYRIHTNKK